jgi:hypothetical protein
MATFAEKAPQLVATAAQIAKIQGAGIECTVLEQATASLIETGYDNWNGGTDLFTLMLEVPIPTYAAIDDRRDELEQSIHRRVSQLVRTETGHRITEVVISPVLADASRPAEPELSPGIAPEDIPSFWQAGFFRLFISHVASQKAPAHRLKEALARYHVAAFVAHDDIEPTKEWQAEIERALRTMDALVAMVAPGFVDSRWCDQEIGMAIGRGKLVVPLRLGADPHGFMGKYQALQVQGLDAAAVAERIVDVLVQHTLSAERMADALIDRFARSSSWDLSKRLMTLLENVPALNASQVAKLVRSIDENVDVGDAWGVPQRIRTLVERVGEKSV